MIDATSLRRPARLAPGDRVAVVSLSWGGPAVFPHRFEAGIRQLEAALGVETVLTPHALREPEWLAANPQARADDLLGAFADPTISAIVSSIGGDDSIRLLPYLDLALITANPKVLMGYSDTTITHMACLRASMVSFYGPAVMAGWAENGGPLPYMIEGVRQMVCGSTPQTVWPENGEGWTVEHLDWADPSLQSRPRSLRPNGGWRWWGGRAATGPIVVGCLEVLDWLRGTSWWPDLDGAVLAIETSEEQPGPEVVARFLRTLAASGELARLSGLLFGRPGEAGLDPTDHQAYDEAIVGVVRGEESLEELPVVTGMDFGHTDPMWTIPIGVPVRIDPDLRRVIFLDAGVT